MQHSDLQLLQETVVQQPEGMGCGRCYQSDVVQARLWEWFLNGELSVSLCLLRYEQKFCGKTLLRRDLLKKISFKYSTFFFFNEYFVFWILSKTSIFEDKINFSFISWPLGPPSVGDTNFRQQRRFPRAHEEEEDDRTGEALSPYSPKTAHHTDLSNSASPDNYLLPSQHQRYQSDLLEKKINECESVSYALEIYQRHRDVMDTRHCLALIRNLSDLVTSGYVIIKWQWNLKRWWEIFLFMYLFIYYFWFIDFFFVSHDLSDGLIWNYCINKSLG